MNRDKLRIEARRITARFSAVGDGGASGQERDPGRPGAVTGARVSASFRVLLVCEDELLAESIRSQLEPFGYGLMHVKNTLRGLEELVLRGPDIVLAPVSMPHMSGYDLCRAAKRHRSLEHIPFVLFDKDADLDTRVRGFQVGADDFFPLPMHDIEMRARVRSLVRSKVYQQRMQNEIRALESRLELRRQELEEITLGLVAALEKTNEYNDSDTGMHIRRVCEYSRMLAEAFDMPDGFCDRLHRYASLHDVGKVAVPDRILKKRGKLDAAEWEEMKRHTIHGYRILKEARADDIACNVALCHHERWDGSGYPQGLSGEVIPVEARIVALCDVYDALVSKRCYKDAFPVMKALNMIKDQAGMHFDPRLVDLFFKNYDRVRDIQRRFADDPDVTAPA